jgi:LemA protein
VAVRQFPNNLVAAVFGFQPAAFFEAPAAAKDAPKVRF